MARKLLVLLAATGALAVGVVGASARPQEEVTLTLLWPSTLKPPMDIMVANFNRVFPSIHVSVQYLPNNQLEQLLPTQFQAGNAPDLFKVQPGHRPTGIWDLAAAGRLLDLTGRPWQKRIYATAKPYATYKNRVYSWPLSVSAFGVMVNADLFRQLRLKVPTKASEVLALCKQITAAGKIPFAQAYQDNANGTITGRVVEVEYVDSVDPKFFEKREKGQVTFASSPLWRNALQAIVDMKDAGCFNPGTEGTSRPQQYAIMARGDAVMSIMSSSELPNILAINPGFHYTMMNLPPANPKYTMTVTAFTQLIAASAATKHPAEAKTFIDFMAREKQSSLYATVSGEIAPLDAKKGKVPDYMKANLGRYFTSGKTFSGEHDGWPSVLIFNTGFATGIQGLFTGQTSVDSTLKTMDSQWASVG